MSNIVFDRVSRVFTRDGRDFPTLDDVSFEVRDKEFVTIVGPSGCGKTTCLRMAAGLEFPSAGAVSVGGATVTGPGPDRSVVFQQFALFPWKTVAENIDFGLRSIGVPRTSARGASRTTSSSWTCRATSRRFRTSSPAACSSAWRSRGATCSTRRCC